MFQCPWIHLQKQKRNLGHNSSSYSWPRLLWSTPILSIVLPKFSTRCSSKFFIFIYQDFFIQTEANSVVTVYAKFRDLKKWKIQKYEVIFEAVQSRFWRFFLKNGGLWTQTAPDGLSDDLLFLDFPFGEGTILCIHCNNTICFRLNKKISVNEDEKFWATARWKFG